MTRMAIRLAMPFKKSWRSWLNMKREVTTCLRDLLVRNLSSCYAGCLEVSVVLAQRVRSAVETHVFKYDGKRINITISLGVMYWDGVENTDSPEELIERVDKQFRQSACCHLRFA